MPLYLLWCAYMWKKKKIYWIRVGIHQACKKKMGQKSLKIANILETNIKNVLEFIKKAHKSRIILLLWNLNLSSLMPNENVMYVISDNYSILTVLLLFIIASTDY